MSKKALLQEEEKRDRAQREARKAMTASEVERQRKAELEQMATRLEKERRAKIEKEAEREEQEEVRTSVCGFSLSA